MKRTIILMMATLVLVTCKKKQVAGPEGPQGPQGEQGPAGGLAKGSIYGKVTVTDPNLTTTTLTTANCTISVVDQTVQAITDANGSYTISGVVQGILDIHVTLPDGATYKKQQFSYSGNGNALMNFSVSKKITETVKGRFVDSTILGSKGIYVFANFDSSISKQRNLLILVGTTNSVSPYDAASYKYYILRQVSGNKWSFGFFLEYNYLKWSSNPFENGQQIFVSAYPLPQVQQNYYLDIYSENYVYYTAGAPIAPSFSSIVQ